MQPKILSSDDRQRFLQDGYIVVPEFLTQAEASLLKRVARMDRELASDRMSRADGEGGSVDLVVRNELPEDSIYGAIVRAQPLVEAMELLLDDEVYHYHHKMILKEPKVGGAWTWHQDYGYWYNNGCLFPDMGSCMIAVDQATRENGCLQVIRGSHKMGRIDHVQRGDQTGADEERIAAALERLELVHVELEPGSAVIFHGNTLHRSDQNVSDHPRWAFICCYNTKRNNPWKESKHPRYSYLERWPAERITEIAERQLLKNHAAS
ncbi:MAG TPA: phytanoyl-CoA dioxygenase family protein [Planctomycetes bacterium]|nr:phytanoyl-CoA dioxygenase family protein [Fuerstiella sp.]HIK92436.1 phytanoyl-CoA dioxygenase family protein [Planctomycetota bacterium]